MARKVSLRRRGIDPDSYAGTVPNSFRGRSVDVVERPAARAQEAVIQVFVVNVASRDLPCRSEGDSEGAFDTKYTTSGIVNYGDKSNRRPSAAR
jgi:hypothetical protein